MFLLHWHPEMSLRELGMDRRRHHGGRVSFGQIGCAHDQFCAADIQVASQNMGLPQ